MQLKTGLNQFIEPIWVTGWLYRVGFSYSLVIHPPALNIQLSCPLLPSSSFQHPTHEKYPPRNDDFARGAKKDRYFLFHGRPNKGFMDWKGDPVRLSREMIPVINSLLYFVFLRSKSFSPCEISSFAWSIHQPPSIACDRLGLNKTSKIINLRYILKAK